ncbi:hypothetical protein M2427_001530 [Bradyrhizobium sp. BR13661]|jgi:hypothetical protein|nr:hypothetical protein [Bradyrhizobium sp. BR13661]
MRQAMALADFKLKISAFHSISCASLQFSTIDVSQLLRGADSTRIVSSWRQIKATIFVYGPDVWVVGGPVSIRAEVCGPNRS